MIKDTKFQPSLLDKSVLLSLYNIQDFILLTWGPHLEDFHKFQKIVNIHELVVGHWTLRDAKTKWSNENRCFYVETSLLSNCKSEKSCQITICVCASSLDKQPATNCVISVNLDRYKLSFKFSFATGERTRLLRKHSGEIMDGWQNSGRFYTEMYHLLLSQLKQQRKQRKQLLKTYAFNTVSRL